MKIEILKTKALPCFVLLQKVPHTIGVIECQCENDTYL